MYTSIMPGTDAVTIDSDVNSSFDVGKYVKSGKVNLTININGGVSIQNSDAANKRRASIYSSVTIDPVGSKITIRNNGVIQGANGEGGDGDSDTSSSEPGSRGNTAIKLNCDVVVFNTGSIQGGGGGGGGGLDPTGNAGGGAGWPAGVSGANYTPPLEGAYGYLIGGFDPGNPGREKGGDCNGAGQEGGYGTNDLSFPIQPGGPVGYSIDAGTNNVEVTNGPGAVFEGDIIGVVV